MAPIKMTRGMANYLVREAHGMYRSRDEKIVVGDSAVLLPGTLMGALTAGAAVATAVAGNTGNATVGTITVGANALPGTYTVVFTSATEYQLRNMAGDTLATGTAGSALTGGPLAFTITAGATAMEAGDSFEIGVTATPGALKRLNLSGSDGTQTFAGILMEEVGINEVVARTITTRDAEVNAAHLIYPAGATAAQIATQNAAMVAKGIILR